MSSLSSNGWVSPEQEKEILGIFKELMKIVSFVGPIKQRRVFRIKMPKIGESK